TVRLQIRTAGIEENALADERDIRASARAAPRTVSKMDDACFAVHVARGYGQKSVRAEALQCALIQPAHREPVVFRKLRDRAPVAARVELVWRQSRQPAREIVSAGGGDGVSKIDLLIAEELHARNALFVRLLRAERR